MPPIVPAVLCGGSGSRLWPASRDSFPKQFLTLIGESSLFQETVKRVVGPDFVEPIVVTGSDYRFLIAEQLRSIGVRGTIVLEPMRRDSCAAIAAAARLAAARDPDALVLVLAADHAIPDVPSFLDHVRRGAVAAEAGRREATENLKVFRPWGSYDSIDNGPRHQVKRITVDPGCKLSLQSHFHRSEHWVVVAGTARITVNDTVTVASENQSVYIPLGATHRLENPGKIPLDLIEVQSGAYLGEDDIVRYEDVYNRS